MTTQQLAQKFRDLTTQLHGQYQIVENAIREIDDGKFSTPDIDLLTRINSLLDPIKQTESDLAPIRDQMQSNGMSTPEDMSKVIDETVAVVSYLLPKIGELENKAKEARQNLAPKIGESVRAMRMQSAYGRKR